jgi:Zn finger protein HypA/HybF involved in hydrogenase expression
MKCVDDVNDISVRIDFVECPKCGSKADIIYENNGEYVKEVNWRR